MVLFFLFLIIGDASLVNAADNADGTFSIVAYDPQTGELGVAVQSKAFHVGMSVAWAEAGVGAIATQATTNRSFGPKGLELMKAGLSAQEALVWLLEHDPDRDQRQVGLVDARGNAISHTGSACLDWAGHKYGPGFAVQGNILAGPDVVANMEKAFSETEGELGARLLAALQAGQMAGGDRRGKQSAALLVVRPSETHPEYRHRYIDLRVEDHPDPIPELIRLFSVFEGTTLAEAHIHYAQLYRAQGLDELRTLEVTRLGQSLTRTLADPDASAQTLNALAWFTAINDMFLETALSAAQKATGLEPTNYEILDTLAEVHYRLGHKKEAIEASTKALSMAPDDPYLKKQFDKIFNMKE
ncbi:DUF1028 domain-containing protein [bacterium]|nr:DUF1028 domain-containing protein [bacterium]